MPLPRVTAQSDCARMNVRMRTHVISPLFARGYDRNNSANAHSACAFALGTGCAGCRIARRFVRMRSNYERICTIAIICAISLGTWAGLSP